MIGPETLDRANIQSGTFYGFYVQDLITIIEPVKLLVGGRYDLASLDTESRNLANGTRTFSSFDEGVFTPRAGIVVQPVRPGSASTGCGCGGRATCGACTAT